MSLSAILSPPSKLRRRSVIAPTLHDDIGAFDREAQSMDEAAVTAGHFVIFRLPRDDNLFTRLNRWIRAFPCVHYFISPSCAGVFGELADSASCAFSAT